MQLAINTFIFFSLFILLIILQKKKLSLAKLVLVGLIAGSIFGTVLQFTYGHGALIISQSLYWFNIVGSGYIKLLQMIVMPLVFVSVLTAVTKLQEAGGLGKINILTIGYLLLNTAIAALIGIVIANVFNLSALNLFEGPRELNRLNAIQSNYLGKLTDLSVPNLILSFLPNNPFADLTGNQPTSIISVSIFAILLGIAFLNLRKKDENKGEIISNGINAIQLWVLSLVRIVISLTPYGIFSLMIGVTATSSIKDIIELGRFVIASYTAIILMFVVHLFFLRLTGVGPIQYLKKAWSALAFAFISRSSAASIPYNIEVQTRRFGVPEFIASFSASIGATLGQNGCAGIYPAMLAVMVAPTVGVNPLDVMWILTLIGVITVSSIGVAGVGGGATYAALIVLPAMGLPITLVALLISIEPLIDMGRTALNVNGSMSAGVVSSQIMRGTDKKVMQQDENE